MWVERGGARTFDGVNFTLNASDVVPDQSIPP